MHREIDRLASLSPLNYEAERSATANRLQIRVSRVDAEVEKRDRLQAHVIFGAAGDADLAALWVFGAPHNPVLHRQAGEPLRRSRASRAARTDVSSGYERADADAAFFRYAEKGAFSALQTLYEMRKWRF
jgi:hypothetical protein